MSCHLVGQTLFLVMAGLELRVASLGARRWNCCSSGYAMVSMLVKRKQEAAGLLVFSDALSGCLGLTLGLSVLVWIGCLFRV